MKLNKKVSKRQRNVQIEKRLRGLVAELAEVVKREIRETLEEMRETSREIRELNNRLASASDKIGVSTPRAFNRPRFRYTVPDYRGGRRKTGHYS